VGRSSTPEDWRSLKKGQFANFRAAAPGSDLYERGLRPEPEGTFEDDARGDRLPAVSWIMPTSFQPEHPDYLLAAGADFVASKIEAIASDPKVWGKTAFILNYDEHDGLFDHVPPPTPPAGTADEFVQGLPIGGGFRVPAIIVSPWTVGGWVASEAFEHTSALRFLERFTGGGSCCPLSVYGCVLACMSECLRRGVCESRGDGRSVIGLGASFSPSGV
jgi:phospholipase C